MNPFVIPTKFTAVDAMSDQVRGMAHNVRSQFDNLNEGLNKSERLFKRLTPGIGGATKQLLGYLGAGSLIAGAGYSGKSIMDYETAIQSLQAVTMVSDATMVEFKGTINDVAHQSKKSATEIAGSFEVVGSMMSEYLQDPKGLRMITEAGITLSKASRQELVPSLEQLTSIMNQFNLKAESAGNTVDKLTAGEIVGSLRTGQVTEALQEFGAGAYSANINLTESVALVEALARQLKTDKIGVGARNILTVMDSATGLAKKARKELRHAGVDMHFLMDKTKSLSERLHELSKVAGNEKAITKIFGRENKTAAQVIFNQLGVFDQYVAQINKTKAAESQAQINSETLAVAVDQLKAAWVNELVASEGSKEGIDKLTGAVHFMTDNLDSIVNIGMNVLKFYALWKGAMLVGRGIVIGNNVVLGIQNALYGASVGLLEANTAAQNVAIVSKRALGVASEMLAGNFSTLNAVMLANPIGLVLAGVAALTGGLYLLNERNKTLIEQYKEKMRLDTTANVKKEADAVQQLVEKYYALGNSIQKANAMAIAERKLKIDTERQKSEATIAELKKQLDEENNKLYLGDLVGTGRADYGKRAELSEQLAEESKKSRQLSEQNSYEAQYTKNALQMGMVSQKDVAGLFPVPKKEEAPTPTINYLKGDQKSTGMIDYEKLRQIFLNSQKVVVEFKNAPSGMGVSTGANITTPTSY